MTEDRRAGDPPLHSEAPALRDWSLCLALPGPLHGQAPGGRTHPLGCPRSRPPPLQGGTWPPKDTIREGEPVGRSPSPTRYCLQGLRSRRGARGLLRHPSDLGSERSSGLWVAEVPPGPAGPGAAAAPESRPALPWPGPGNLCGSNLLPHCSPLPPLQEVLTAGQEAGSQVLSVFAPEPAATFWGRLSGQQPQADSAPPSPEGPSTSVN